MKTLFRKSLGIILIDVMFIGLIALPSVRQATEALVLFGCSLAIMTVLSIVKNLKEIRNNEQEQEETIIMKVLYYIGVALTMVGFAFLVLK